MGEIRIKNHGLLTLIQDNGRYGYQQFGVPVSGVMDSFSHRVANILLGNDEGEALLEATILGPEIEFMDDSLIVITGGDLDPVLNGEPISMWESVYVKKGDILAFGGVKNGCRAYIAFAGGIQVEKVMGSRSTYVKAKIGGLNGGSLKSGDILKIGDLEKGTTSTKYRKLPNEYIPTYSQDLDVRVILGPQDDYFTQKGLEKFLSTSYKVTNECDRMGYRLEGEVVEHINGGDIISDGINFGAIQIPSHGQPIIMMSDRQTIGGYTKIANVISIDLPKIAQAKPGDSIRFKKVSIYEAQELLKKVEESITTIKKTCINKNIVKTNEILLRISGEEYNVKVEELG
ncbi:biotin-dependent carboxyltransferase family protein [Clostridium sp. MSJ-11]|uniref:Biotin-dependent carboxyltransferase family protein n=1 Tax=Clostridium mobile TaxID=2841512 RepID=A0ABS6EJ81_9CLOT|nr:biotin-dependent carboxyltransferase family protein [Clostridium mobile]MBU5485113.1 biotin-dependent carboxyltransferase family protein [Clostridium mobile]